MQVMWFWEWRTELWTTYKHTELRPLMFSEIWSEGIQIVDHVKHKKPETITVKFSIGNNTEKNCLQKPQLADTWNLALALRREGVRGVKGGSGGLSWHGDPHGGLPEAFYLTQAVGEQAWLGRVIQLRPVPWNLDKTAYELMLSGPLQVSSSPYSPNITSHQASTATSFSLETAMNHIHCF